MNQQMKNPGAEVARRVDNVRRIYSKIGQPLPADIIIDLHLYLGKTIEMMHDQHKTAAQKRKIQ